MGRPRLRANEGVEVFDNGNGTMDVHRDGRAWRYDLEAHEVNSLLRRHDVRFYQMIDDTGYRQLAQVR